MGHVLDEVAVIGVAGEKKVLCFGLVFTSNPQERQPRVRGSRLNIQLSDSKGAPAAELALVQKRLAQVETENMKLAGE